MVGDPIHPGPDSEASALGVRGLKQGVLSTYTPPSIPTHRHRVPTMSGIWDLAPGLQVNMEYILRAPSM